MAKALTVVALEKFKPDPKKRQEIPDGLMTGLYFIVQPTGRKSWAVRYRYHGKPRKLALGTYPALDLVAARERAQMSLRRVQLGEDPAADKQLSKRQSKGDDPADRTRFDNVCRTFLARHAKPNNRSWKETARQFGLVPDKDDETLSDDPMAFVAVRRGLVDKWGHRPIMEIKRAEIIAWLDDIVDRGAPVMANRTLAALRKLFNWAIARDLLDENPCEKIKPPAAERSRDRVLSDDELRACWIGCDELGWPFGPLIKMLVLTGQRRDEVGAMTWNEVDGNAWTIPQDRVKTDVKHEVPLSAAACAILDNLPRIAGRGLVFTTNGQKPVSGFSKAKERLDARMLEILSQEARERGDDPEGVELPPWRLHDIRRTVASGMARMGVNIAVIEKLLNHTSGSFGGIVGVYQRHEFADEKREAIDTWGCFIGALVDDQMEGAN